MNWFGNQQGEGIEYHILAIAIAVALMIKGGGRWSIDRAAPTIKQKEATKYVRKYQE